MYNYVNCRNKPIKLTENNKVELFFYLSLVKKVTVLNSKKACKKAILPKLKANSVNGPIVDIRNKSWESKHLHRSSIWTKTSF